MMLNQRNSEHVDRSRPGQLVMWFIVVAAVGVTAVLAAALNLEADMTYTLQGQKAGVSATGVNWLCLPYDRKAGLATASDLMNDIENNGGGTGSVNHISRYIRSADALKTYAGGPADLANDFGLHPGESYIVSIDYDDGGDNNFGYDIEGDHDPGQVIKLYAPGQQIDEPSGEGTSRSGIADYCPPYYDADAWTAVDLKAEIDANVGLANSVNDIQRFIKSSDSLETYAAGPGDFSLVAGEGYRIQMNSFGVDFYPDAGWASLEICDQGDPSQDVADNLESLLRVTFYQDIPEHSPNGSEINVRNLSTVLAFDVDYTATFSNDPQGPADCHGTGTCSTSDCKGNDECPGQASNNCDECETCSDCRCCVDVVGAEIDPGEFSSDSCGLPGCQDLEDPPTVQPDPDCFPAGCDNGRCDSNTSETHRGHACELDSECPQGSCIQALPDCGWHCTDLIHLGVSVTAFTCTGESEEAFSPAETWSGTEVTVPHPRTDDSVSCVSIPPCDPGS